MNRKERIFELLGMSQGTARHRLVKQLLFKYITLASDNFCYVCGEEITNISELSIEHKLPWENVSADLFWDLDNIAFSHLTCNQPHNRSGPKWDTIPHPNKKMCPTNFSWCSHCQRCLEITAFSLDKYTRDGLHSHCKNCRAVKRTGPQKVWS